MNTSDFDFNLLPVFEALFQSRNVTRAAQQLNLTQATVSNALRRMRVASGNPLFVRFGGAMVPTPYAEAMAQKLLPAVQLIREGLSQPNAFEPLSSHRIFTVLMADIVQYRILPSLFTSLRSKAPHVEIDIGQVPREQYGQALESGSADLAIGHFQELQSGFYQQRLFEDRHICVAGKRFRGPKEGRLTMDEYLSARHLVISSSSTDAYIDRYLAGLGHTRRVGGRMPNYLVISEIMQSTNFLVTMSSRSATSMCGPACRQFEIPLELPEVNVRQFWHARYHQDPGNQWLRQQISNLKLRPIAPRVT